MIIRDGISYQYYVVWISLVDRIVEYFFCFRGIEKMIVVLSQDVVIKKVGEFLVQKLFLFFFIGQKLVIIFYFNCRRD